VDEGAAQGGVERVAGRMSYAPPGQHELEFAAVSRLDAGRQRQAVEQQAQEKEQSVNQDSVGTPAQGQSSNASQDAAGERQARVLVGPQHGGQKKQDSRAAESLPSCNGSQDEAGHKAGKRQKR